MSQHNEGPLCVSPLHPSNNAIKKEKSSFSSPTDHLQSFAWKLLIVDPRKAELARTNHVKMPCTWGSVAFSGEMQTMYLRWWRDECGPYYDDETDNDLGADHHIPDSRRHSDTSSKTGRHVTFASSAVSRFRFIDCSSTVLSWIFKLTLLVLLCLQLLFTSAYRLMWLNFLCLPVPYINLLSV